MHAACVRVCWKAYACSDERVIDEGRRQYTTYQSLRTELVASLTNTMQQLAARPALLATVSLLHTALASKLAVQIEPKFTSTASCK
jgi:hypothetical protein